MFKFEVGKTYYNLINKNHTMTVQQINDNVLTAVVSEKYLFDYYNNYLEDFNIQQNKKYQYIQMDDFIIYKASMFEE